MKKNINILIVLLSVSICGFGQNKEAQASDKLDTLQLLRELEQSACECIGKIPTVNKNTSELVDSISNCVRISLGAFDLGLQMHDALLMLKGEKVDARKKPVDMAAYRGEMELWLRDSCPALNKKMASNEKTSAHSFTDNEKAMKEYNNGVGYINNDDYERALPYFKRAVAIDPVFAFAWDNIGVCNRKLGNWDEAIAAYRKSLEIDPRGITGLHNIPIVYELKKEYDNALREYKNLSAIYPDDPEALYGAGRVYITFKNDLETGLSYMCKAYNAYARLNSPYRIDAEKNINFVHGKMKAAGKEDAFFKIVKENDINYPRD